MNLQKVEQVNGIFTITTETKRLLRNPRIRIFESQPKTHPSQCPNLWRWIELPECFVVPDHLCFQLDIWAVEHARSEGAKRRAILPCGGSE